MIEIFAEKSTWSKGRYTVENLGFGHELYPKALQGIKIIVLTFSILALEFLVSSCFEPRTSFIEAI